MNHIKILDDIYTLSICDSSSSLSPDKLIKNYYKNKVDIKIIDTYIGNNKKLLALSAKNDINIFKKNKKGIKPKKQIINECKKKKKKIIKDLSKSIKILSNNPNPNTINEIKIISKHTENDIDIIDDMLKTLYSSENDNIDSDEYIEVYSN